MQDLTFLAGLDWLPLEFFGGLLLAAVLGGAVGLEREWSGKPAGFRTNLLICVGAALITELSVAVSAGAPPGVLADPGRIAAQVVSGIGFLGAGTIIQSRVGVTGLTTAATLWVVAAIGMAVGAGAYVEAVGTTTLVILVLLLLRRMEGWLTQHFEGRLRVSTIADPELVGQVEQLLAPRLSYTLVEMERDEESMVMVYDVSGRRGDWTGVVARLMDVEGVRAVRRS
ncbi:MAG: MgtC/SapB family protein [Gemmatimonadota bacterium]